MNHWASIGITRRGEQKSVLITGRDRELQRVTYLGSIYTRILSFTGVPPRAAPDPGTRISSYCTLSSVGGHSLQSHSQDQPSISKTSKSQVIVNPRRANNNSTSIMQTDGVKYEKSDSASYGAGLRCSYARYEPFYVIFTFGFVPNWDLQFLCSPRTRTRIYAPKALASKRRQTVGPHKRRNGAQQVY